MTSKLGYTLYFIIVVLLQVLVFNNIEIAGLINPYIYIYIILILPMKINRQALLFIGFLAGCMIDVFSNTMGIHAAATTFAAYIRPTILNLYCSQEEQEKYAPTLKYIGGNFIKYAATLIFIHHLTLFMLEAFDWHFLLTALLKSAVSSIITLLLITGVERIKK